MAPACICCAVSRVPAPAVSSSLNAKGGDSLHKVDVADRVRVCTACGTCSTSTGKHPKLSMETVLPRIPDCLRRHQRAEMRVAFVSACNGCKLKCEFTGSPKVGKLPAPSRHRSPTRSQTVRGSRHSPITSSRSCCEPMLVTMVQGQCYTRKSMVGNGQWPS